MKSADTRWHDGAVTAEERAAALGFRGATVWMTGLPASGKSTLAVEIEALLVGAGRPALRLDGDNLRHGLNAIGRVRLRTGAEVMVDPYAVSRATGAFILIDEATNDTAAAGMIA